MILHFWGIHLKTICCFSTLMVCYIHGASLHTDKRSLFSIRSVRDKVWPAFQPFLDASSNGCDSIKSLFGISYSQLQAKNTSLYDYINIDLITKDGNVQYALVNNRQMRKLVNNSERIMVLTHGFMETSEGEMVQAISSELLKQSRLKIFALDGRKTINFEYLRSSTHATIMGEMLGNFLAQLIKGGQEPSNISLIGHSLGAHIAGVAGRAVKELTGTQLGRITGLDPAGPCYNNVTLEEKLDRSDAAYVDVIHTNGKVLGLMEPMGHKDFYPNGGTSQAGCLFYICDHSRAWELFAESINVPTAFPANKCSNWTLFQEGKCNNTEVTYMGINSETGSNGIYFLATKPSKPFGLGYK